MNRGYHNLKELEAATVEAVEAMNHEIENIREECRSSIKAVRDEFAAVMEAYRETTKADIETVYKAGIRAGRLSVISFWQRVRWFVTGRIDV